jgi:hypothetical protein
MASKWALDLDQTVNRLGSKLNKVRIRKAHNGPNRKEKVGNKSRIQLCRLNDRR